MARLPRVTILQLDPTDPPGPLMGWLTDAGTRPAIVAVWESGVPTIGTIGDGLVVLGGPMSAHSQAEHPWLVDLAHLVVDAHTAALPTLGVCLGHLGRPVPPRGDARPVRRVDAHLRGSGGRARVGPGRRGRAGGVRTVGC